MHDSILIPFCGSGIELKRFQNVRTKDITNLLNQNVNNGVLLPHRYQNIPTYLGYATERYQPFYSTSNHWPNLLVVVVIVSNAKPFDQMTIKASQKGVVLSPISLHYKKKKPKNNNESKKYKNKSSHEYRMSPLCK